MAIRTVLVVDDDALVRKVAEHALSRHGYRIVTAASADAALERLDAHPDVCVVVTDLVMPGRDGRWLLHAVRQARPALPVVLLTGSTDGGEVTDLPPGAVVMGKPFEPAALAATVTRLINGGG